MIWEFLVGDEVVKGMWSPGWGVAVLWPSLETDWSKATPGPGQVTWYGQSNGTGLEFRAIVDLLTTVLTWNSYNGYSQSYYNLPRFLLRIQRQRQLQWCVCLWAASLTCGASLLSLSQVFKVIHFLPCSNEQQSQERKEEETRYYPSTNEIIWLFTNLLK